MDDEAETAVEERTHPELLNRGSLITYLAAPEAENESCLGYLMDFGARGIFDAVLGKLADLTPEEAKLHNQFLDDALIEGLDTGCDIGKGGTFYAVQSGSKRVVKTFIGTLISDNVTVRGPSITFYRKGMSFRGRLPRSGNAFNFRRVR